MLNKKQDEQIYKTLEEQRRKHEKKQPPGKLETGLGLIAVILMIVALDHGSTVVYLAFFIDALALTGVFIWKKHKRGKVNPYEGHFYDPESERKHEE